MRRLLVLGYAALLLAACGGGSLGPGPVAPSPSVPIPSPTAPNYEGVWQIEFRVAECSGYRACALALGSTRTITVRLVSELSYDGVVNINDTNVDVTGLVGADGGLLLTGLRRPAISFDLEVAVRRLQLQFEDGRLTGTFEYTMQGPPIEFESNGVREAGPIVAATKVQDIAPFDPLNFSGRWTGHFAVRECSSTATPFSCPPHDPREVWNVELALTQAGGSVTGTLVSDKTRINVEGTAGAGSMMIHGSATTSEVGYQRTITLRSSTLRRNRVGRLEGTIALDVKWTPTRPDLQFRSTDLSIVEFIGVALRPS